MKPAELRDLEPQELSDRLRDFKEELFNLRFQLATGQLDDHRRLRRVRRDIARVSTFLRQKEIDAWEAQPQEQAPEPSDEETAPARRRRRGGRE